jgi:hypothetical protein
MDPTAILRALADLAPAAGERVYDVTRGGPAVAWLGRDRSDWLPRNRSTTRLAAIDALQPARTGAAPRLGLRDRRRGGQRGAAQGARAAAGGTCPVGPPVAVASGDPGGDAELTPFITDPDAAERLETAATITLSGWLATPEAAQWVRDAADAAGLPWRASTRRHRGR